MPNVLTTDSVTANHAEGIGQIYGGGDRSQIIWTKEDFAKFYATAPIHIADFVKGTELFGFRRGDLVEAPLDADKGHTFEFVTGKSRRGGRKGVRGIRSSALYAVAPPYWTGDHPWPCRAALARAPVRASFC